MPPSLDELKRKRARFYPNAIIISYSFVPIDKPIQTAPYEVTYLIAKQEKPQFISDTLFKPAALRTVDTILGKTPKDKFYLMPLSNEVVRSRIDHMNNDIFGQVLANLKARFTKLIRQLDKTTNVADLNQLLKFPCYVKKRETKKKFLFCKPLATSAKETNVKKGFR